MRVGDEDRQLSMKEIRKIILKDENEIGKWESKVSDYTIEDIDEELLKEFIEKGRKAKRINFPYTNKEEILKKLSLVNKNNELLNVGYILFAKEAKLEMQMAIFATETKLTFLDIDQVFGNIFELIEIGEGSIPRNPLIANTLYLSKDIEKWGSGFRRITEVCAKADVKVKFEIRKNGFMVIFYRKTDEELLDLTGENKNTQEKTYVKTYENTEEKILYKRKNSKRNS